MHIWQRTAAVFQDVGVYVEPDNLAGDYVRQKVLASFTRQLCPVHKHTAERRKNWWLSFTLAAKESKV